METVLSFHRLSEARRLVCFHKSRRFFDGVQPVVAALDHRDEKLHSVRLMLPIDAEPLLVSDVVGQSVVAMGLLLAAMHMRILGLGPCRPADFLVDRASGRVWATARGRVPPSLLPDSELCDYATRPLFTRRLPSAIRAALLALATSCRVSLVAVLEFWFEAIGGFAPLVSAYLTYDGKRGSAEAAMRHMQNHTIHLATCIAEGTLASLLPSGGGGESGSTP